ncbi:MAG TPA: DUF4136 domain-containing protein [Myxococcaceae bacterium]|nr:DUF4136 domain-containing protein [Myxococcaceae bacterium]
MRQVALAAAMGLLAACYPGGAETLSDLDTVTTQHDPRAAYDSIHTYAMPSSIQETPAPAGEPLAIDHSNDTAILATVAANLNKLGWRQVDPATATPDVNVMVSVTASRYREYVSYPFHAWYPGWPGFTGYDDTWSVYYPYGGGYATIIDAGSLRIEMLDTRAPNTTAKQLTAIWTASLDGVIGGSAQSLLARVNAGIDQAFAQSPYL